MNVTTGERIKNTMRRKSFCTLALAIATLGSTSIAMQAQHAPATYPELQRALTDLHAARALLAGPQPEAVRKVSDHAVQQIDAAIGEIKQAAIDDKQDMDDRTAVDTRLAPHDRFRQANELLGKAHEDVVRAQDTPQTHNLRIKAMYHIDDAHHTVDQAVRTAVLK